MYYKYGAILISLSLIILFSGCLGSAEGAQEVTFISAPESVAATFVNNAPPEQIFENDPFNIWIEVENRGEYPIPAGDISIGMSNVGDIMVKEESTLTPFKDYYKIINNSIPLNKRTRDPMTGDEIPGGKETIMFNNLIFTGGTITEQRLINVFATILYPYTTIGVSTICITQDRLTSSLCEPIAEREITGTSGPIKIVSLEQKSNGYEIGSDTKVETRILINLKIQEDVKIFKPLNIDETMEHISTENENLVYITGIRIGNNNYTLTEIEEYCGGSREISFNADGEAKIICKLPVEGVGNDYEDRFEIYMNYIVRKSISTDISFIPEDSEIL